MLFKKEKEKKKAYTDCEIFYIFPHYFLSRINKKE